MSRTTSTFRPAGADSVPVVHHVAGAGPRVAITANVHGDELTGVAAVHALDRRLERELQRGSVALYPSLNPAGLHARTRVHPSGHDLNRVFPGNRRGSPAERHALGVWQHLEAFEPDAVLDLHADSSRSIPYAIVDRALRTGAGHDLSGRLTALAAASGLTVLHEYPEEEYVRYALDRSLAGALVNRAGVAAVTVEAGPRRWVDPVSVDQVVSAVFGMLAFLGLVEAHPVPDRAPIRTGRWRRAASPRTRTSGLFVDALLPGTVFEPGAELGRVVDLEGRRVEPVVAEQDGIVISWSDTAWLPAGSAPGTIGVRE